jgi:hypothetical protein
MLLFCYLVLLPILVTVDSLETDRNFSKPRSRPAVAFNRIRRGDLSRRRGSTVGTRIWKWMSLLHLALAKNAKFASNPEIDHGWTGLFAAG